MLESNQSNLSVLKDKWAIAEVKVSYEPIQKTNFIIKSSTDAEKAFREMWDKELFYIQEQFCALFVNQQQEVIGFRVINTGSLSSTTVDVKFLLTCALQCRAASIFIAHNHPSGNIKPSSNDDMITYKIKEACETIGLNLIDHLILVHHDYYSYIDESKLLNQ